MKNRLILSVIILLMAGCSKKNNVQPPSPPEKATLTFPASSALCTSGTVLSATQSSVIFTWNASAYTDSYETDVKNLLTGVTSVLPSTTNQVTFTLLRNTPYSWFVVSKSNKVNTTSQSDTWKFYLAGVGVASYSPFPASIISPSFGEMVSLTANAINLTWSGSDVDNDIVSYDVYFGSAANPPLLKGGVTDMFLNAVTAIANTTYYWKVITKDSQGNTSDSGVFQFKTN